MGEVVNLRLMRKARDRQERDVAAASNRAAHGQTKAERAATTLERARTGRALDGARLDD